MKWSVGSKLASGFGLGIVFLVAIGLVSYQGVNTSLEATERVTHTHEVLENLEGLIGTLKDAETGQRGYILTGETRYLEPYFDTEEKLDAVIEDLRQLMADNPGQEDRLDQAERLIADKLDELQETIQLRDTDGLDVAVAMVLTDVGKDIMDTLRVLIDEMKDVEQLLLTTRTNVAEAAAETTKMTIWAGTLIALLLLGLAWVAITRDISVPLREMSRISAGVTGGDLDLKVKQ